MEDKQARIIIMYEIEQIEEVLSYLERENISLDACTIIPLEFQIEHTLRERGIPYESLLEYIPIEEEFIDIIESTQKMARRLHEHQAMRFYTYQGINLGEVFEPMVEHYLQLLGRYLYTFRRIADVSGAKKMFVPYSTLRPSVSMAALVPFEFLSPVDAAIAVGRQNGFAVETIGIRSRIASVPKKQQIARYFSGIGLMLYNACIRLCIRPRPLKLYASEYWFHIESFIEKMDDVELVFMERKEIKNIPWRQLLKHRIRFLHPSDAVDANARRDISQAVLSFSKQWHVVKDDVRGVFSIVPGIDAWPEIERALTYLIETQTARALVDIEGLRRVMQNERPDKVLLRASIGGTQQHLLIATQVAHQLGIPSIELQHAGAVMDPRLLYSRLFASYLAAYGQLTRDVLVSMHQYAPERIRPVGSPRFDHYVYERDTLMGNREKCLRELGLDPARPVVFAAVPMSGPVPSIYFGSYQVANFFKMLRDIQKGMPELQFIFKFRPGDFSSFSQDYIRELFTDGGVFATSTRNFLPLVMASDIACTGNSTLMYEVMLGKRPMILFPWKKYDTYYLEIYERAASAAFSSKELSALLRQLLNKDEAAKAVERQNRFLAENYSFDGHAPERTIDLLREKLLPLP